MRQEHQKSYHDQVSESMIRRIHHQFSLLHIEEKVIGQVEKSPEKLDASIALAHTHLAQPRNHGIIMQTLSQLYELADYAPRYENIAERWASQLLYYAFISRQSVTVIVVEPRNKVFYVVDNILTSATDYHLAVAHLNSCGQQAVRETILGSRAGANYAAKLAKLVD